MLQEMDKEPKDETEEDPAEVTHRAVSVNPPIKNQEPASQQQPFVVHHPVVQQQQPPKQQPVVIHHPIQQQQQFGIAKSVKFRKPHKLQYICFFFPIK